MDQILTKPAPRNRETCRAVQDSTLQNDARHSLGSLTPTLSPALQPTIAGPIGPVGGHPLSQFTTVDDTRGFSSASGGVDVSLVQVRHLGYDHGNTYEGG